MKRIFLMIIIFSLFSRICFALTVEDNGYAWNSSNYEERIQVCKQLSLKIGKDYLWWFGAFNAFYDTTDGNILRIKIKEAAVLLPAFDQPAE